MTVTKTNERFFGHAAKQKEKTNRYCFENEGTKRVVLSDDGYTFKTADGGKSAHFEHTVVVTERGAEILTKLD